MVSYGCCGQITCNPFEEEKKELPTKKINMNPVYKISTIPITERSYAIILPIGGIILTSAIGFMLSKRR